MEREKTQAVKADEKAEKYIERKEWERDSLRERERERERKRERERREKEKRIR